MSSKTDTVEVKPCPFCGTSISGFGERISGGGWLIECECGGEMSADTQLEAIAAWNHRFAIATPSPSPVSGTERVERVAEVMWRQKGNVRPWSAAQGYEREDTLRDAGHFCEALDAALTPPSVPREPPEGESVKEKFYAAVDRLLSCMRQGDSFPDLTWADHRKVFNRPRREVEGRLAALRAAAGEGGEG
jgi:hypothetical protein